MIGSAAWSGGQIQQIGITDANGNFSYTHTAQSGDVGEWGMSFYVGYGANGFFSLGTVVFTVQQPLADGTIAPETTALLQQTPASVYAQVTTGVTTPATSGGVVTQSSVAIANANAASPINNSGGVNVPTTSNANFTFNVPNNPMQVGDTWVASITGAQANAPVVVQGGMNGVLGNVQVGTTDANGDFSLSGTCTSDEVGSWTEQWIVGGDVVGNISFVINNVTTQSDATATQTGASTTTSVNAVQTTTALTSGAAAVSTEPTTTSTDGISDFMTGIEALFSPSSWSGVFSSGDFVQIAGLIAIPAIALYMFTQHSKGRR
jgi:hypothetical protein